ncbi:MAG: site-specific integrase, partial [Pseudomonadota bacterium]|nr:site-specific integrase [Pseudomonadota bacterium]
MSGIRLSAINRVLLEEIIQAKSVEGVKPRTVNGVINTVRAVLNKAWKDWEWIDRIPKFRMLPEPKRRIRFITREEAERLLRQLPEHLRRMAIFALETGLRRANVTGLRWNQLDLERRIAWVHPDEAKARKAIAVPLSRTAIAVIRECLGQHEESVFTYKGKRVMLTCTNAWANACKRANIEDFRWHDLRHTWASWHVQDGTPLHVLQELGGWESSEMVRKYAHLTTEHLASWVERHEGL